MMIDIGLKFYSIPSHPMSGPTGQSHRLRNFMLKFYIIFLKMVALIYFIVSEINVLIKFR